MTRSAFVFIWVAVAGLNLGLMAANLFDRDWAGAFTNFSLAALEVYIAWLLHRLARAETSLRVHRWRWPA